METATETRGKLKKLDEVLEEANEERAMCLTEGCEIMVERGPFAPVYCSECQERNRTERVKEECEWRVQERRRRVQERKEKWMKLCPPLYRQEIDYDNKQIDPAAVREVLAWEYGPMGIMAQGPSRTGKSRSMFKLLERLFVGEWQRVNIFQTGDWHREVATAYGRIEADEWHAQLLGYDIVYLDDLDKIAYTDREELELLSIIEKRASLLKPTFATLNMAAETLQGAMRYDRGAALVNRLVEFFEVVKFKEQGK